MRGMKGRVGHGYLVARAGVVLAGLPLLLMHVSAQNAQTGRDWSRIEIGRAHV